MRARFVPNRNPPYSWRDRARDPALTTMLAVQCMIIFSEPFAAMGFVVVRDAIQLLFLALTFIVYLISGGPIATGLAISAFISDSAGYILDLVEPSETSLILGYAGSITAFAVACYALGYAALAPGFSDGSSGAGSNRTLFEHRLDLWHDIPIALVFDSGLFDEYIA